MQSAERLENNIPLLRCTKLRYYRSMLTFLKQVLQGMALPLEITRSPLYRYPYRNAPEAMRGDWLRIGSDIECIISSEQENE